VFVPHLHSALITAATTLLIGATHLAVAPSAWGTERVVVSTGSLGGAYHQIGERLKTQLILRNERIPQVMTSQGSLDNLARLDDPSSPVNVVISQVDALRSYLETHDEFREEFFVLGDMGKECVLLITSATGGPESVAAFKQDGAGTLAVGGPGSGASVTFQNMASLEPAFHATQPVFVPIMEALLQLEVGGEFTEVTAAMIVQRPRRLSPPLRLVLDKPDAYRFVPVTPADVPNGTLPDGRPVYSFETVAVGGKKNSRHRELQTLCTDALLLGSNTKIDHDLRERLSTLMQEVAEKIAGASE
jgi:hypothetical protein